MREARAYRVLKKRKKEKKRGVFVLLSYELSVQPAIAAAGRYRFILRIVKQGGRRQSYRMDGVRVRPFLTYKVSHRRRLWRRRRWRLVVMWCGAFDGCGQVWWPRAQGDSLFFFMFQCCPKVKQDEGERNNNKHSKCLPACLHGGSTTATATVESIESLNSPTDLYDYPSIHPSIHPCMIVKKLPTGCVKDKQKRTYP